MSYICLYDSAFTALGKWTQHIAKNWQLKRQALDADEFTATCQGWQQSKDACFVGLHNETGALEYVAFCGLPTTKDGLTTVIGTDTRLIFDQKVKVAYDKQVQGGGYAITSISTLFQYLLQTVFEDLGISLGVTYDIDVSDTTLVETWNDGEAVDRSTDYRNVYEELQKFCNVYDCVLMTTWSVNILTNKYKLTFRVQRIYQTVNIKLSDYDVFMKLTQNIVNRTIATNGITSVTYYLYNDNTVSSTYTASRVLFPPKITTIYKEISEDTTAEEALAEAEAEAIKTLNANRYKDKVTINLKSKLGSTLRNVDFTYFADVSEYNPADASSVKRFPVYSIQTDSSGAKKLVLGRLSDYWFMDK